jgi:hypothetical protein
MTTAWVCESCKMAGKVVHEHAVGVMTRAGAVERKHAQARPECAKVNGSKRVRIRGES